MTTIPLADAKLKSSTLAMAGKNAFVPMPTGGGKSLCYQIPAIAHPSAGRRQGRPAPYAKRSSTAQPAMLADYFSEAARPHKMVLIEEVEDGGHARADEVLVSPEAYRAKG